MSSLGTSKGILEIFKFGIYVTIPIALMYTFANNSKNLQKFMGNAMTAKWTSVIKLLAFLSTVVNRSYIVYPPEAPRPPSPEELREMAREMARKRNSS